MRSGRDGREHGLDDLEPPLWPETRHLLTGPSHSRAAEALDVFLAGNAETRIEDPVKRAHFQRDLWSALDWLAGGGMELEKRIARVIRRVVLRTCGAPS